MNNPIYVKNRLLLSSFPVLGASMTAITFVIVDYEDREFRIVTINVTHRFYNMIRQCIDHIRDKKRIDSSLGYAIDVESFKIFIDRLRECGFTDLDPEQDRPVTEKEIMGFGLNPANCIYKAYEEG